MWDGYTVHDASNVFRRYLNDLPEPVVPLDFYEKFREPLRGVTKQMSAGEPEGSQYVEGFDEAAAIAKYEKLITELPPLNRQLLLYILDLLAVFAAKSEQNRMNSQNLAAIFQPGMLSHPDHAMAPEEYRLNQYVLIFLIENQDHFLIGMQGTAADEKTKLEVEQGTPTIELTDSPSTPNSASDGLGRSTSNASAAAVSVRRDGMVRRNRSTASRHSRQDSTGTAPGSPALVTTPTSGLGRSNTLPSKRSPALPSGRFRNASPRAGRLPSPSLSPNTEQPGTRSRGGSPSPSSLAPSAAATSNLTPSSAAAAGRSQEKLIDPGSEVTTPVKERNLQSIFQRSPTSDADRKPRNKLKKRVPPGGVNRSAQSSTASLTHSNAVSPKLEPTHPAEIVESHHNSTPAILEDPSQASPHDDSSEPTPRGSQQPPAALHSENSLRPEKSPPTSIHSSFNDGSERGGLTDDPHSTSTSDLQEREKRKRWRISRSNKKDENASPYLPLASPRQVPTQGSGIQGESNTSIASGSRPRKSMTNDSSEVGSSVIEGHTTQESSFKLSEKHDSEKEESKGPIGWIKNKYREAKETHEQKRTKSPPGDPQPLPGSSSMVSFRGRSLDLKRDEEKAAVGAQSGSLQASQAQQTASTGAQQAMQTPTIAAVVEEPEPTVQTPTISPVAEEPPEQAAQTPTISPVLEEPPQQEVKQTEQAPVVQESSAPAPAQETPEATSQSTETPVADPGTGKAT